MNNVERESKHPLPVALLELAYWVISFSGFFYSVRSIDNGQSDHYL